MSLQNNNNTINMGKNRSSSSLPFNPENSSFNDIDAFIDYDAPTSFMPSPTLSRSSFSSSQSSTPSMNQKVTTSNHLSATGFPAPSHQYDLHTQQTGTLPVNSGFYPDFFPSTTSMAVSPAENHFMQLDNDSTTSLNSSSGMMPAYFYPETAAGDGLGDFVNPSLVLGASPIMMDATPIKTEVAPIPIQTPPVHPTPAPMATAGRYYVGIHQHQAAYEQQQQQQRAVREQRQQPQPAPLSQQQQLKVTPKNSVGERIDKILSSMKSNAPHPSTLNGGNSVLPHIAKLKKEEDEMDEDERLLASEEGKKLTSKERRQLRNKVSARAFRSRRKEYITQLEQEVANKTNEAADLQHENTKLKEENSKLSDLTRMLLSSPAFSMFLDAMQPPTQNDISEQTANDVPDLKNTLPSSPDPSLRPNARKDVNPNLVPACDESEWPLAYNTWGTNTPQVFSVLELPQDPPSIQDLSGKVSEEDTCDDWKLNPLPVADGFYPIRNEKADASMNYYFEEDDYEPPEDLFDAYEEEFGYCAPGEEAGIDEKKTLDDLFPGTGVEALLERLEMIVGGQAKPEDFFEEVVPEQELCEEVVGEEEADIRECTLGEANKMLDMAEGIYRRIGLVVGGQ